MIGQVKTINGTKQIVPLSSEIVTVDSVTSGNMNAVTSNAVAEAISSLPINNPNVSNATGTLTVAHGGTGQTTQLATNKAIIGELTSASADVTDGTEFISSNATDNGFAETNDGGPNKPYKRQFIKVWNYIKGKISSVLGLTATSYGGNSATATYSATAMIV